MNRPIVLQRSDGYHMWYTGQTDKHSAIGYARSGNGVAWRRVQAGPVLLPEAPWENVAVMCPHVLWDENSGLFRMWYSGGTQGEPNAVGYATSEDGVHWRRQAGSPVLRPDPTHSWERERVSGAQVIREGDYHYAFYIGFYKVNRASIGLARSRDGISNWERHPENPILRSSWLGWDRGACYKPYAVWRGDRWLLWYNGRAGTAESIGLAEHQGRDFGFPISG